MTTELAPSTGYAPALAVDSAAVLEAVRDPNISADKAERLFALAERLQDQRAKAAFYDAMNRVQAEMMPVTKKAENSHTHTHYARLEDIDRMLTPVYVKHGFSLSISTADSPLANHRRVVLTVRHSMGHSETHHLDAALDGVGAQGRSNKTEIQAMGSTLSYCDRYLKCKVFNVRLVGEDDDGNGGGVGPGGEPITENQLLDLRALMQQAGADEPRFLQFLALDSLADLPKSRLNEAVRALNDKLAKKGARK